MYEKRLQQVEVARKIKSSNGKFESPNLKIDANTSKNSSENNATDCIDDDFVVGGRCLNNGTGNTDFNKLLAEINIPELNWHTYKTYEMEVAKKVEYVARENCMAAAIQERKLTIENAAKLKDLL
ncbi:hypothetical protein PV328_008388 [Microctonus aethiopoides]|uniref:Mutator-like transposase domain-containing protein n=1 Tax=Microctonus aethiopoides TaxID=144406 RepID=A0AA39FJH1_9HYME|nr:hypothetical protein PV328_008388 [Microctonus aethiopoides]